MRHSKNLFSTIANLASSLPPHPHTMIRKFIPNALALGLIAASAQSPAAPATPPAAPGAAAEVAPVPETPAKPGLEEEKLSAAMQALGDLLHAREKESAAANLEKGKKFLDENGKRTGVTTTASGLQYEVLVKGGDEKYVAPKEGAADNKEFLVNYKGTLIDGKEFDASPAGKPVPMTLQVVPGFKEALTTMPVGAKWKLFIPSALAYGEERKSAELAPNSVLIFELELVKIQDAPPQQQMPFQMPGGPGGPGGPQGEE